MKRISTADSMRRAFGVAAFPTMIPMPSLHLPVDSPFFIYDDFQRMKIPLAVCVSMCVFIVMSKFENCTLLSIDGDFCQLIAVCECAVANDRRTSIGYIPCSMI